MIVRWMMNLGVAVVMLLMAAGAALAEDCSNEPQLRSYVELPRMAKITQEMLVDGLDAFTAVDSDKAWDVIKRDDEVDALYRKIFNEMQDTMANDPSTVPRAIQIIFVAKHMERIADYVTNICELVVYMKRGAVIKHVYED